MGLSPWTDDREVRRYLRGVYKESAIGAQGELCDPLYRELVELLVAAVIAPTSDQLRDRVAILVVAATGLPAGGLARITWRDVRWIAEGAQLTLPPRGGSTRRTRTVTLRSEDSPLCPVRGLRRLREDSGVAGGYVFRGSARRWDSEVLRRPIRILEEHGGDVPEALAAVSTSARQLRDRALLLLGYGAALRPWEAARLCIRDVETTPDGLLVHVPHRREACGLWREPGMPCDPVASWIEWLGAVERPGHDLSGSAFPQIYWTAVLQKPMPEQGLNRVVRGAAEDARLDGNFAFSSLRIGYIRSSVRSGEPTHAIAATAGIRRLSSLARHDRRENLIRGSIAGQLGL